MHVPRNRLSACEGAVVPGRWYRIAGGATMAGGNFPCVFSLSLSISYEKCSN